MRSYATVDSKIIIDKCNKLIDKINKIQEQDNTRLVEEHRKKINAWWWRFWRGWTLDAFEAKYDLISRSKKQRNPKYPSRRDESYSVVAKSLKALAQHCESITITLDDWNSIDW
jgi:hypothetical protein